MISAVLLCGLGVRNLSDLKLQVPGESERRLRRGLSPALFPSWQATCKAFGAAVSSGPGVVVLAGPAGSGKTFTLLAFAAGASHVKVGLRRPGEAVALGTDVDIVDDVDAEALSQIGPFDGVRVLAVRSRLLPRALDAFADARVVTMQPMTSEDVRVMVEVRRPQLRLPAGSFSAHAVGRLELFAAGNPGRLDDLLFGALRAAAAGPSVRVATGHVDQAVRHMQAAVGGGAGALPIAEGETIEPSDGALGVGLPAARTVRRRDVPPGVRPAVWPAQGRGAGGRRGSARRAILAAEARQTAAGSAAHRSKPRTSWARRTGQAVAVGSVALVALTLMVERGPSAVPGASVAAVAQQPGAVAPQMAVRVETAQRVLPAAPQAVDVASAASLSVVQPRVMVAVPFAEPTPALRAAAPVGAGVEGGAQPKGDGATVSVKPIVGSEASMPVAKPAERPEPAAPSRPGNTAEAGRLLALGKALFSIDQVADAADLLRASAAMGSSEAAAMLVSLQTDHSAHRGAVGPVGQKAKVAHVSAQAR